MASIMSEDQNTGRAPPKIVTPAEKLRNILNNGTCNIIPCCSDGLTAKLVEQAGFKSTFMSGFSVSATRGFPDCQLVSFEEMRQSATVISSSCSIPVIGDGDTGYGNCVSIKRTVKAYCKAGLAAIMIEDQKSPKRCGHVNGKSVVSREMAYNRIKAACDARDELVAAGIGDILVLARTDARCISMDEAIIRCQEFRKIGCDITFLEAPRSKAEMREYCTLVSGPKMANMLEGGKTPILPNKELEELGFALAVRPITLLSAAIKAMQDVLVKLKNEVDVTPHLLPSFGELKTVVGFDEYFREDAKYAV